MLELKKKQKTKRYLVAYEKLAVPCYSAPNSSLKLVLLLLVHIVPADYCMQRRGILKWILRIGTVIKNELLVFQKGRKSQYTLSYFNTIIYKHLIDFPINVPVWLNRQK